jgi:transposase
MLDTFANLYSHSGRPSVPPGHLLRASFLQVFYTIRSEQLLMENCNVLVVDTRFTTANGKAEHRVALDMIENVPGKNRTIGGFQQRI